jgi:hypothetical protein
MRLSLVHVIGLFVNRPRNAVGLCAVLACSSLAAGCDPYLRFAKDDDSLGPVDPVNFPPGNLGAMGNRMRPGVGSFVETAAFVGGSQVGYFAYAMPAPSPASADLLRLIEEGKPYASALATPTAYLFDSGCTPPGGYAYDPKRDEVRYDGQGNVFTALPSATYTAGVAVTSRYVPIVAEAPARAQGLPCQKVKSEDALAAQLGGMLPPRDGKYRAWLIIDPAAGVYPRDDPKGAMMVPQGLGMQSWGWYKRYLLAYLDGGPIPTMEADVNDGTMAMPQMKHVVRMVTQKLYYPRSMVMGATTAAAGARGAGYDVLQARRQDPGYSPVCEVITYDAGMPLAPADLPKDAAAIETSFGTTFMPGANRYVFCLQVR